MRAFWLGPVALISLLLSGWLEAPREKPPEEKIQGIWTVQHTAGAPDDTLRFYYFHKGGIGLFRYGKRGLNKTNSFAYEIEGDTIEFRFKRTGERYRSKFRFVDESGQSVLVLANDPRMGKDQSYVQRPEPARLSACSEHPFARMWIRRTRDVRGHVSFEMYQFQAPKKSGAAVGWFHSGDYDDWSTESFTYEKSADRLTLHFDQQKRDEQTKFSKEVFKGKTTLRMASDPRNYWHPSVYIDDGPSFMMSLLGGPMPYAVHAPNCR